MKNLCSFLVLFFIAFVSIKAAGTNQNRRPQRLSSVQFMQPALDKPSKPKGDTIVCNTHGIYFTNQVTHASSYQWVITPLNAGIAQAISSTVEVTWNASYSGIATIRVLAMGDGYQTSTSEVLTVSLNPFPLTPAIPTGLADICQNVGQVTYSTTPTLGAISYNWSISPVGAGEITGTGTTCTFAVSSHFSGFAFLHLNSLGSCHTSGNTADLIIKVSPMPADPALSTGNMTLSFCKNQKVSLTANNVNNDAIYWFDNRGKVLYSGSNFVIESLPCTGIYKLTAKNQSGCASDTVSAVLTVEDVKADFTSNLTIIKQGDEVNFISKSTNAESVTWLFGDGFSSPMKNTNHVFHTPGLYDVTLFAISKINCKDTLIRKSYITVNGLTDTPTITALGIRVYPLPAGNMLYVDTNEFTGDQEISCKLYTLQGLELQTFRLRKGMLHELVINSLPAGVYILQFNLKGQCINQKIIKSI